jgi:tetratricopeptide (TPR) repeat protein
LKVHQIETINNLIQSKGLSNYASLTPSVASYISQKLDANVFVYGSVKKAGPYLKVNAQLIDTKTEESYKSFEINGLAKEEMIFKITDTLKQRINNFLIISVLQKKESQELKEFTSTSSPDAFRYYLLGSKAYRGGDGTGAIKLLSQAIERDTNFYFATLLLSITYYDLGMYGEAKKYCLKAYEKKDQMSMQQQMWTDHVYALNFGKPQESIKYCRQILEYDDQAPLMYYIIGYMYSVLQQYNNAIPEFNKSLDIYRKWDTKPFFASSYTVLGYAYHQTGKHNAEKKLYKKAEKDFPDKPQLIYRQAILALSRGNQKEANKYIEKYIALRKENSLPEAALATNLANIYLDAGVIDKAEEYFRQALSLEPGNPSRLNNLAWLLIDNERNINEGMVLIDKALESAPENYVYLDTKAWGLYKQEKYKEALDLLEKAWSLKPVYSHVVYLHLEAAKKAVAGIKQ